MGRGERGREGRGRNRLGYLSRDHRVPSYATGDDACFSGWEVAAAAVACQAP